MNHRGRIIGGLLLAFAFTGLAACATPHSLNASQALAVQSGQQSALAFGYSEYKTYLSAEAYFENVSTGERYRLFMESVRPGIVMVPPGRYHLRGVVMSDMNRATANLPLLSYWYDDFEVGPGEVVDIGKLVLHEMPVTATATVGQHFRSLFDDHRMAGREIYMAYSIDPSNAADIAAMLEASEPQLTGALVRRPLQARFERVQFERAVAESYNLRGGGTPPPMEEAEANLAIRLQRLIEQSAATRGR